MKDPKCEHGIALSDLCDFVDRIANDDPSDEGRAV